MQARILPSQFVLEPKGITMIHRESIFIVLATVTVVCQTCSGCFVRNCPVGGKRSQASSRECLSCGDHSAGVCLSSTVCCLPYIGCVMNDASINRCSLENKLPWPCTIKGRSCGQNGGTCVVDGICCNGDQHSDCYATSECLSDR